MFELSSKGIYNGYILDEYGIKSDHVKQGVPLKSLPFSWTGAPEGTKSFAIVFQDYDNIPDEGVCWIHWIVADISKDVKELLEDASRNDDTLIQGTNSWAMPYGPYADLDKDLTVRYGGPAPSREHEYETKIYALDTVLGLKKGFYLNELMRAMEGHILEESTLKGSYKV